ncbi:MAG: carboxymuconolactone decarboxylase family protein [Burkholderiaceae bacterium]
MSSGQMPYPRLTHEISARIAGLRGSQPAAMHGFRQLSAAAMDAGAISARHKELMALALGIGAHCEGCIGFHAKALAMMGATRAEVEETVAVAVYMGGGPALMVGASALDAYDQFRADAAPSAHEA